MGTMSEPHSASGSLWRWVLQSPPAEWALRNLRELLIGALKQGPIPQHVAFVMDGNRRFAKQHRLETIEGHNRGFEALARILDVCYRCGVKVVTVYAFSIENYKRSKFEVDALMDMGRVKLEQLSQHGDVLDRYGACIRVLGQRELVSPEMLAAVDKAVSLTAHNNKAILNICFPYTSRAEITNAIRTTVSDYSQPLSERPPKRPFSERRIADNLRARQLSSVPEEPQRSDSFTPPPPPTTATTDEDDRHSASSSSNNSTHQQSSSSHSHSSSPPTTHSHSPAPDRNNTTHKTTFADPESITASTLDARMLTAGSPPLDLLVRTSGVERLSDFMLWQCHERTSIKFLDCLWPDFNLWRFLPILVEWQWWQLRSGGARVRSTTLASRSDEEDEDEESEGVHGLSLNDEDERYADMQEIEAREDEYRANGRLKVS